MHVRVPQLLGEGWWGVPRVLGRAEVEVCLSVPPPILQCLLGPLSRSWWPELGGRDADQSFAVVSAPPQDNIRDKLHPIVLSMNYSLLEKSRKFQLGPHSLDAFPVLNQDQSHHNETKVGGMELQTPGKPGLGWQRAHRDVPVPPDRVPEGVRLRQ